MPFLDHNGDELAVSNQVIFLATVSAVRELSCTIDTARQGSPASLDFTRTEPALYTVEDEVLTAEITGTPVSKNDEVAVLGTITALASGIHNIANIDVVQGGETVSLTFYTNELILATVTGDTITGALSNPT